MRRPPHAPEARPGARHAVWTALTDWYYQGMLVNSIHPRRDPPYPTDIEVWPLHKSRCAAVSAGRRGFLVTQSDGLPIVAHHLVAADLS